MHSLQNSSSISNKDKVREWLELDQRIDRCPSVDSATYALLLRKIGVAYFNVMDYSRAVQYTLKSQQILRKVSERSSANLQDLSDCYFNLQLYYDSLGEVLLQGEAADSCLAIDSRINSDYYNSCFSITGRIRHLFNKGDYFLCLKYCALGEGLIQEHYHYPDSFDIRFYIQTYKVDALVLLKDFTNAESILLHMVSDCQPPGRRKYLGTVNGLLGLEHKLKGDRDKSVYYFKECYKYNSEIRYNKGCAEALNNIGDQYLQVPFQLNDALAF
jgi:tetratricopeptide (TPR) repeat protein